MKWVRLHNKGDFDVITALSMIGASVKDCDDPIGLYGSGVKYAMAQCLRQDIQLKIADKGKVYTLIGKERQFRGETFNNVAMKEKTGRTHITGITSEFGSEDWNQPWFVFREFYSNMLDENGEMTIVDRIEPSGEGVDVFLPYAKFAHIVDSLEFYFTDRNSGVKPGTGRVFKKGVFIGELDGIDLDFSDEYVQITETRTLNNYDAKQRLGTAIECSEDVDVWEAALRSANRDEISVYIGGHSAEKQALLHEALVRVYGPDYLVCPDEETIIKDADAMGFVPVVLIGWDIKSCDKIRDYKNTASNLIYRDIETTEQTKLDSALRKLSLFLKPGTLEILKFRVFKDANKTLGQTDFSGNVDLSSVCFNDETVLVQTLLHEINHIQTGEGDYSRGFPAAYEKFIVSLML